MGTYHSMSFTPVGSNNTIAVSAVTARAALARSTEQQVVVKVDSMASGPVFIKFGTVTVEAAATDFPMFPGEVYTFHTTEGQTHIAAICPAGATTVYAHCGDGA